MAVREPLVDEGRLARAWEMIVSRVPGLDLAAPDAYVQGAEVKDGQKMVPVAVFTVSEPNPRYSTPRTPILQVSAVHFPLSEWERMEREAKHFVSKGFDPLTWCLFQAVKGHTQVMANIRAMSHPVIRIDEHGREHKTYPTGD